MKKDVYFGTYKNSNVNILNNYIKLIDDINSKYYNFSFPFTKGNFDLNYQDYIKDKKLNYNSKKPKDVFEEISYLDVLNKDLKVMDSTATSLCRDNNIPLLVFGINEPENILKAVMGEKIGTLVEGE